MISAVIQVLINLVLFVITKIGYAGIFFLMLLESANIPIPSEVIMPFSGFLAQKGIFDFWLVVVIGAAANLIGSLISYWLAQVFLRRDLIRKYRLLNFFFNPHDMRLTQSWFDKYGKLSVFFGRIVPVVRTFISFPAGLAKMNIVSFAVLTFFGSLVWSIFLTWTGFFLGENWMVVRIYFEKFDYLVLMAIIALLVWWVNSHFFKKIKNPRENI